MKSKIINGVKHLFSEEQETYLPIVKTTNGITYRLDEATMTYLAAIDLPDAPTGMFAAELRTLLQENCPSFLEELIITMQVNGYLTQKSEEYTNHYQTALNQLMERNPLPQTDNYLEAAQWNNGMAARARELVLAEMLEEVTAHSNRN